MKIMPIQYFLSSILVLMSLLSFDAGAVTCRSGLAASKGSQAGYKIDTNAAQQNAQNDKSSSDTLGQCVAGITAVQTAPQFPSMAAIFDQIKNKVCQMASNQINNAVYAFNNKLYQQYNNANSSLYNQDVANVIGTSNIPKTGGVTVQSSSSGNFWSNFWN